MLQSSAAVARVVVPGLLNKLLAQSIRLGPRRPVTALSGRLNARPS